MSDQNKVPPEIAALYAKAVNHHDAVNYGISCIRRSSRHRRKWLGWKYDYVCPIGRGTRKRIMRSLANRADFWKAEDARVGEYIKGDCVEPFVPRPVPRVAREYREASRREG